MSDELKTAIEAAKEAEKILLRYFLEGGGKVERKSQLDRVTQGDKESELRIIQLLKGTFPQHRIVGEEFGDNRKKSHYTWYIDPLCGTFNFIHGLPEFGVSIGLAKGDIIILGAVSLPVLNEIYWAEKGKGAYLNGRRINVSKVDELRTAVITSDYSKYEEHRQKQQKFIEKILPFVEYLKTYGSFPYSMSLCAKGKTECHFELYAPSIHRAGSMIILTEAGGKITNFKGENAGISDDNIVASNGSIHDKVLKILNQK